MPVAAVSKTTLASRGTVINAGIVAALAVAAAVFVAIYDRSGNGGGDVGRAVRESVNQGVNGVKAAGQTVAGLFEMRSPGERATGALASLKPRKQIALHQRALPKVRAPATPLATIVGAAPILPVLPAPAAPLYNIIGKPNAIPAATPLAGSPAIIFPGFSPLPGGGGGVLVSPPAITPPETPVVPITPVAPTVPEPATWAMMLIGFAMIGRAMQRRGAAPQPTG